MRRNALFVGVLVLTAAARFAILLTSQTHVHSDEAIIGLMGKHIMEGRYFPSYMYGQPYNAGAAWEGYLAAIAFALFGVSVIALKGCIVVLSLLCVFLFYLMCLALYDQRAAVLATIVFALTPSLLKWHFQVRGYSWYFLSIPVLTLLFLSIESTPNRRWPRFFLFGIDTVLWYYPEKPASGFIFYTIAILAVGVAAWPFIRSPLKVVAAIRGGFVDGDEQRDLLLLLLIMACFVPYVTAPLRVPGYFLAGCFFFAVLNGRLLERCFTSSKLVVRLGGIGIFVAAVITATAVIIDAARHNEIETLTLCDSSEGYCMTRIAGSDLERVENH